MPTPTGLPKKGERVRWLAIIQGKVGEEAFGTVVARGTGAHWSLTVKWDGKPGAPTTDVDAAYHWHVGWLKLADQQPSPAAYRGPSNTACTECIHGVPLNKPCARCVAHTDPTARITEQPAEPYVYKHQPDEAPVEHKRYEDCCFMLEGVDGDSLMLECLCGRRIAGKLLPS